VGPPAAEGRDLQGSRQVDLKTLPGRRIGVEWERRFRVFHPGFLDLEICYEVDLDYFAVGLLGLDPGSILAAIT
jgi:hypothetical protein